jgi:glycosyltransferase involved in cell wall biosynthesis
MLDKMRILHVTPFYPPSIGGISNLVFNLCGELDKLNLDVHIITSRNILARKHDDEKRESDRVIEIKSVHLPGWPYSTLRNFSFPADLGYKVNAIIKNGRFDLIHVHGHHYPICWFALYSAHKNKVPTVLSLHGTYALNPTKLGGRSPVEDLFNKYIFRRVLRKCDVVIGGTNQIIEYARKYSSAPTKFKIIPNGVNSHKFSKNLDRKEDYRNKFKIDQNKTVILFVGRFDESKGALNFAKAAALLLTQYEDKFEIIMVGQGILESQIRSVVEGIRGLHLLEWQPAENIHEIYISADIFVLPSKFEALPLSILEAMAAGLYIIYSNVGGVDEILQNYPKKNMLKSIAPEEISHACLTVNKNGIPENKKSESDYKFEFDWRNVAKKICNVYTELVQD